MSQIRHLVNFKTRPKRNQVSAASKLDCDTSKVVTLKVFFGLPRTT